MDLAAYRTDAERFTAELGLAHYRHFAGLSDDYAIEPIYARHATLFTRAAVDGLRAAAACAPEGDERRRRRALVRFGIEGHLGRATKAIDAELARREAELRIELEPGSDGGGASIGFRESAVVQANEPDPESRARIEAARLAATDAHLTPLHLEAVELAHAHARELGWPSYRAMFEELDEIDLGALERQTTAFLAATDDAFDGVVGPEVRRTVGIELDALRRSDLPRFFRAPEADALFPEARLVASFVETMADMGIDVPAQRNVVLDVERRPTKSPRAFCSPVRVPEEIYLVVPPIGGRDDYQALFHEGGHAQHFAWVDPALPWEFRALGDNSVTEAFAFLFDHLVEDPGWLSLRLGVHDDGEVARHIRAQRLVYLRRYCAKLAYELELHGDARPLPELAPAYAAHLSAAVRVDWPAATFLSDVDPGFYVASYLRAWALETHLRAELRAMRQHITSGTAP